MSASFTEDPAVTLAVIVLACISLFDNLASFILSRPSIALAPRFGFHAHGLLLLNPGIRTFMTTTSKLKMRQTSRMNIFQRPQKDPHTYQCVAARGNSYVG